MNIKRVASAALLSTISLLYSSCSGNKTETVKLQGAGASFPAPLYLKVV